MRAWRAADGASYEQAVAGGGRPASPISSWSLWDRPGPPPPPKAGADLIGLTGYVIGGGFLLSLGDPRTQTFTLGETSRIRAVVSRWREDDPRVQAGRGRYVNAYTKTQRQMPFSRLLSYYLAGDSSTRLQCGDSEPGSRSSCRPTRPTILPSRRRMDRQARSTSITFSKNPARWGYT